ncbi:MAG TPA: hypothetical protein VJT75_01325 [Thermoleophilaceae bacterium]|nr:hypothetical protein [Thermoleophilaceae bacterium]
MRLPLLIAVLASLALAGAALAAGSAKLSFSPNTAGAGSVATVNATPPDGSKNPSSVALKVVKGLKYDGRAVPGRCSDAQAKQNSCPAGSRAGGGRIDVTATPGGPVTVNVALFLGPKRQPGDLVGLVAIATVQGTGQKGHAFGRVRPIDEGKLGVETRFDNLNDALKPPAGFKVHVDHLKLSLGKHRQVNGKRVDLLKNPKTCDGGWAFRAVVRYPDGTGKTFPGSASCKPGG